MNLVLRAFISRGGGEKHWERGCYNLTKSHLSIFQNYHSCFEDSASGPERQYDLHQPYEILNSSAASSHVVWNDVGVFIFTVKVIDQEFR